jgi:RIO kinase 2
MVRLDLTMLRYLSRDDFRVLTALEMGMKNHDLVSTQLINSLAALKRGDAVKAMQQLHRNKLVYHESQPYDGYRLTYHGYDFLSMKAHVKRGNIVSIGSQIGVGKESDVFMGADEEGKALAVKFHRLGRTSFRSIKRNRDYHKGRTHASWMYLSRLAALKEFAYMKVLFENGFPVPTPIDVNRHVIVMEFLKGYTTLYHIHELKHPSRVYNTLMNLLVSLAECGLVHGDFNEFNLMVDQNDNIIMIDFPQMISVDHENAAEIFDRDVQGVRNFFKKRFGFHGAEYPVLSKDVQRKHNLDKDIQASGFTADLQSDFDSQVALQKKSLEEEEEEHDGSDDGSDEDNDADGNGEANDGQKESQKAGGSGGGGDPSSSSSVILLSPGNPNDGDSSSSESDDDQDEVIIEESRKERRDRLRREAAAKKAKKSEESNSKPSSSNPDAPSSSTNTDDNEHSDTDTIDPADQSEEAIRARIIKSRVKAQLDRKRLRDRVAARNAFKLQAKRNLAQQSRGWAEDL